MMTLYQKVMLIKGVPIATAHLQNRESRKANISDQLVRL